MPQAIGRSVLPWTTEREIVCRETAGRAIRQDDIAEPECGIAFDPCVWFMPARWFPCQKDRCMSHDHRRAVILFAGFLCLAQSGCGREETPVAPAPDKGTTESADAKPKATISVRKLPAATEAQAKDLVKQLDAAIAHQSTGEVSRLFDQNQLMDQILAGFTVIPEEKEEVVRGLKQVEGVSDLPDKIVAAVRNGGDYRFVRLVQKDGQYRPLYRLTMPEDGGVNYHELVVEVSGEKPLITNVYLYLSGESLSESVRRVLIPALASEDASIVGELSGTEAEILKNREVLRQINSLMSQQKFEEASAKFSELTPELQRERSTLMTQLVISQGLSDAEQEAIVEEMAKQIPGQPCSDFPLFALRKKQAKHDDVIQIVDRLQKSIEDPYLDLLKVDALLAVGKTDEAREAVVRVKTACPDRSDVYWMEIAVSLKTRNFDETARLLDEVGKTFGLEFRDLSSVPEYSEFIASEQGKAWLKKQDEASTPKEPAESPESPAPAEKKSE